MVNTSSADEIASSEISNNNNAIPEHLESAKKASRARGRKSIERPGSKSNAKIRSTSVPAPGCSNMPDDGTEVEVPDGPSAFDGIKLRVDASEDEFDDSDSDDDDSDSVKIRTPVHTGPPPKGEEIPPEVIKQLKQNPALHEYINSIVESRINERISQEKEERPRVTKGKAVQNIASSVQKSPSDTTIYHPALRKGAQLK